MSAHTVTAGVVPLKYQQCCSAAERLYLLLSAFPDVPSEMAGGLLPQQQATYVQNSAVPSGAKLQ